MSRGSRRPPATWPLRAAGFTTAFGAHGVAASLGYGVVGQGSAAAAASSLLLLGALLAVYDAVEVVLKPVFGALSDRVGAKPVLLGGLLAFAVASGCFLVATGPVALWAARLGQGAAAAAFSPAASTLVARLSAPASRGRAFGSYGAARSLGHTAGPVLGGVLVAAGGLELLFGVLAGLALAVAVAAGAAVPAAPPLPRTRQTVLGLARELARPGFTRPTAALAGAAAALSVGVGFLPVVGAAAGLGPVATGAVVSLLALAAAVVQPVAGRAADAGRLRLGAGVASGSVVTAAGLAVAAVPGPAALVVAAVTIGAGTGLTTPLAFALLSASCPPARLGRTMGSAEVGRELGDAGGPLLVAGVAAAVGLGVGLAALAVAVAVSAAPWGGRRARTGSPAGHPGGGQHRPL